MRGFPLKITEKWIRQELFLSEMAFDIVKKRYNICDTRTEELYQQALSRLNNTFEIALKQDMSGDEEVFLG